MGSDGGSARPRRAVSLWSLLLAVLVALAAGGAGGFVVGHNKSGGGGGNKGTGTNQPLTKPAFLAAGDAICARTIQQVLPILNQAIRMAAAGPIARGPAASYFGRTAEPLFQQEVIGLRSISPPPQDSNTIKALLTTLQNEIYALETDQQRMAAAFASGGTTGGFQPFPQSSPMAYTYGFRSCPFQKP